MILKMLYRLAVANDLSLELAPTEIKIGDFTWYLTCSNAMDDDVLVDCFYHATGHFIKKANERT